MKATPPMMIPAATSPKIFATIQPTTKPPTIAATQLASDQTRPLFSPWLSAIVLPSPRRRSSATFSGVSVTQPAPQASSPSASRRGRQYNSDSLPSLNTKSKSPFSSS